MALIEWIAGFVASSVQVRLRKRPCGAFFRVLRHWSAEWFHAFSRAAVRPETHAGRGFQADGLRPSLWRPSVSQRRARGGLLRSLLEHKVLQPSSWTAVPYGTLLAAQRLGDWEEVNSCAKAAAELTAGRCSR